MGSLHEARPDLHRLGQNKAFRSYGESSEDAAPSTMAIACLLDHLRLAGLPDVPNALVRDGRVDRRIADGAMTHENLQGSGVHAPPCQGIASTMAKHVYVDGEFEASGLAEPLNKLLYAVNR
jgi:hypothetical protein